MPATENVRQVSESHNPSIEPLAPRCGVLTLFGLMQLRVDRSHLIVQDRLGTTCRYGRFARVGHGLRRVVVVSSDGTISLAAIRWLSDQRISFVLLERSGK